MNDLAPSRRRSDLWYLLPIFAVAFLAYFPSLRGEFVWDDSVFLGRWIIGGNSFGSIFFPKADLIGGNYYHPFTAGYEFLEYTAFGLHPSLWRLAGLGLHLSTVAGVFYLLRRVLARTDASGTSAMQASLVPAEAVGAAIFAVWPVSTEALTWIAANAEVLMTMFVIWAMVLHLRARDAGTTSLPSAVLFFGALMSKEVGVVFLPLAVLATVLVPPSPGAKVTGWRAWTASALWLPQILAYLAYSGMRHHVMGGGESIGSIAVQRLRDPETYGAAIRSWGYYVREELFFDRANPIHLALPSGTSLYVFGAIGALLIAAGMAAGLRKRGRPLAFAAAWFVIALGPPLAIAAHPMSVTAVACRYLYMPTFGLVAAIALAADELVPRMPAIGRRLAAGGLAATLVVLGLLVVRNGSPWMSDFVLWARAAVDQPAYSLPHANLGAASSNIGDMDKAIEELRVAAYVGIPLTEAEGQLHFTHLAAVYLLADKPSFARVALVKAASMNGSAEGTAVALASAAALKILEGHHASPGSSEVHVPLDELREQTGLLQQAAAADPLDRFSRLLLATAEEALDEPVRARDFYLQSARIALPGTDIHTWATNHAKLMTDRIDAETDPFRKLYFRAEQETLDGKLVAARASYEEALAIEPDRIEALNPLAELRSAAGDNAGAAMLLEKAVEKKPDNAALWFNLGFYRMANKDFDAAADAYSRSSALAPGWPKPYLHRGIALEKAGRKDEAIYQYERFLERYQGEAGGRAIVVRELARLHASTGKAP